MTTPVSRRHLLTAAGTTAATFWIPKRVYGYSKAEMLARVDARTGPGNVQMGSRHAGAVRRPRQARAEPRDDAGEPAGDRRRDAARMRRRTSAPPSPSCRWRPARLAICTAKVSEAEALFAEGVENILMTTANVTRVEDSAGDAASGRSNREFIQAVDYPQNARDLSDAAKEAGVIADVVVDVAVGTRTGVPAGDQALALAQLVDKLPNLKLRGIISYDGGAQHIKGFKTRARADACSDYEAVGPDVRADESVRPEHRDLQRRRHRDLQHHDEGARDSPTCRWAAISSWTAVPRDWRRDERASLHRLCSVADGDDDCAQHLFPGPAHDRCGREGADAQQARSDRHR